jgi:hypothetical protein
MDNGSLLITGVRVKAKDGSRGTVLGESKKTPGEFAVEWDDGELAKHEAGDLELVDTQLETDYEAIQEALSAAAEKLSEANALASKHNTDLYNLHYSDDISFSDLFSELNEAGWSTSSMRC